MPVRVNRPLPKVKPIYAETYKGQGLRFRPDSLPTLTNNNTGFDIVDAFLKKAGSVELDGKRAEFQDIRIYLQERV